MTARLGGVGATAPGRVAVALGGALAATAAVVGLYSPVLGSWFVGDDLEEIMGGLGGIGGVTTQDLHPGRNFRPLNLWLHGVTQRTFGWDPLPFHLTAVLLHVVASFLVAAMARSLIRWTGVAAPRWTPTLAGVLFAVAPNHPEAVSWISTRGDILIVIGSMAALACWCRERRTWPWTLGAMAGFAVALVSKEASIVMPAVVTILEVARARPGNGSVWRAALRSWPWWGAVAVYLVVRRLALGTVKSDSFRDEFIGESVVALVRRCAAMFVRTFVPGMTWPWWIVVGLGAVVLAVLVRRSSAPRRDTGARVFWLALAVVIVVAIAPVGHLGVSAVNVQGERLVYLPSAFGAVLVAWPLARLIESGRRTGVAAVAIVVLAASASLHAVNRGWAESARVAESFTEQLGRFPRDERLLLLTIPDLVDGVQCMRNAVWPALSVRHGWRPLGVASDVLQVDQDGPDDRIDVRRGDDPHTWLVTLEEPGARIIADARSVGVSVRRIDDRRAEITLTGIAREATIAWFSEGRIVVAD